jgi:hypothetical protein
MASLINTSHTSSWSEYHSGLLKRYKYLCLSYSLHRTSALFPFNEHYSSRCISRAAHTTEMFVKGFVSEGTEMYCNDNSVCSLFTTDSHRISFHVLPDAWLIHQPSSSIRRSDVTSPCDPHSQLRNVQLRFESLVNLFIKSSHKNSNLSERHCMRDMRRSSSISL